MQPLHIRKPSDPQIIVESRVSNATLESSHAMANGWTRIYSMYCINRQMCLSDRCHGTTKGNKGPWDIDSGLGIVISDNWGDLGGKAQQS